MIIETVDYVDFDGNPATKKLYFNIGNAEMMENLDLLQEHQDFIDSIAGPKRGLGPEEVRTMLMIVKKVMKLAYGERVGDRHVKNDEVWQEFTETIAYDTFLMSLFENPEKVNTFLAKLLPEKLVAMARKEGLLTDDGVVDLAKVAELPVAPDPEPTDEELLEMDFDKMTPEQQKRAWVLKSK